MCPSPQPRCSRSVARIVIVVVWCFGSAHGTPLVSLKAVMFRRLDGKPDGDFAGAVEKLEQMIANATAKLTLLAWPRR